MGFCVIVVWEWRWWGKESGGFDFDASEYPGARKRAAGFESKKKGMPVNIQGQGKGLPVNIRVFFNLFVSLASSKMRYLRLRPCCMVRLRSSHIEHGFGLWWFHEF
ncbi:hypothetical protein QQ045_012174 [Rhodiola kirilowii]